MQREWSQSDLGDIKIHKNVIASIAVIAANEIEGVQRVERNLRSSIMEFLGRKSAAAVRVEIRKNDEVRLEVPLIIKYGFHIPDVASRVQENIRTALEKMTSLSVKDIAINVQGIEKGYAQSSKEEV